MTDDLARLADSFREAGARARHETEQVVSKGALNIKTSVRAKWRPLRHTPYLWRTVGYDIHHDGDVIWAEIGPDVDLKGLQGPLGGIIEEGSVNNAPIPALRPAQVVEEPRFADALGAMGERLLDGR